MREVYAAVGARRRVSAAYLSDYGNPAARDRDQIPLHRGLNYTIEVP